MQYQRYKPRYDLPSLGFFIVELEKVTAASLLWFILFTDSLFWQVPGVSDIGLKPRNVRKAAVIGGGLMGSGIATALILGNIRVILKEVNSEYLQKGIKTIEGDYSSHASKVGIVVYIRLIDNWSILVISCCQVAKDSVFHSLGFVHK